jgi:hypothetical protein
MSALSPSCDPRLGVDAAVFVFVRSIEDELDEGSMVHLSSAAEAVDGLLGFPFIEL